MELETLVTVPYVPRALQAFRTPHGYILLTSFAYPLPFPIAFALLYGFTFDLGCNICYACIMNADVAYWVQLSKYDIDTAKAMLQSRRYLYVLFTCQQAVEKMAKALVVQNTKTFPPKTHDILRLLTLAAIEPDQECTQFLARLNYYYLETRYPAQISEIARSITGRSADGFYKNGASDIFMGSADILGSRISKPVCGDSGCNGTI